MLIIRSSNLLLNLFVLIHPLVVNWPAYAGGYLGVADCRAIRPGLTQAALSKKNHVDLNKPSVISNGCKTILDLRSSGNFFQRASLSRNDSLLDRGEVIFFISDFNIPLSGGLQPLGIRHFYDAFGLKVEVSIRAAALEAFQLQEGDLSRDLLVTADAARARG